MITNGLLIISLGVIAHTRKLIYKKKLIFLVSLVMPNYRIHIQLENDSMKEFLINDMRKDIDLVYLDFRRRTYEKNGAGRVIYFDLVMIADESLKHLEERNEVLNQVNDFGINNPKITQNKFTKKKREYSNSNLTLGDRQKL